MGEGRKQRVRKLTPDRCANLRCAAYRGQPVEPRHQQVMQARRDRERQRFPVEYVAIRLLAQQAALQNALGQFLDEQWHAVGAVDDLGDDLIGQCLAAGDPLDQHCPVMTVEAIEHQHRHLRLARPGRLELGPEGHDQQHR
jgi:hypothetical protein